MVRPTFLCIGAIKSATSWLHQNLTYQPDIWVPPVKELHYFNRLNGTSNFQDIVAKQPLRRFKSAQVLNLLKYHLNPTGIVWYYRYYFGAQNDHWYQGLFSLAGNRICGEFTPGYAILKESSIQSIARLNPNIKIIYCLRNPVDRALSHYRMSKTNRKRVPKDITRSRSSRHGDYVSNYKRWLNVFPADQILVIYYDELLSDPKSFLNKVLEFIGSKADMVIQDKAFNRKSSSYPYELEDSLKKSYAKSLLPLIEEQHQYFNNAYTKNWLDDAIATIDDSIPKDDD